MRALSLSQEVHRAHLAGGSPVVGIFGHSNNLVSAWMLQVIAEMFSNGLAVFEELLLKEAIHHGDGACPRRVLLIVGAAFHDLCADGVEISRAHAQPGRAMVGRARWWRRFAININALAPVISLHRAIKRKTDLLNARNSTQIVVELPVEDIEPVRFVASHLWIDVQNVAVRRVETEISMLHVIQAASQQPRRA